MTEEDRIMRFPEVCAMTGLARSTLYRLARKGLFPRPSSLGQRAVGWRASEVRKWLEERKGIGSDER